MMFENPTHAAATNWGRRPNDAELPQLRRASDIIFAYWLRNNPNPKNLHYYLVNDVQNEETMPLIASIVRAKGHATVPFWPGITMGMWQKEAEALLGM
jgi:hypothetical protein